MIGGCMSRFSAARPLGALVVYSSLSATTALADVEPGASAIAAPSNETPPHAAAAEIHALREFRLGGGRYEIELPESATISSPPGGGFAWIELAPSEAATRTLWIETPFDETQPFAFNAEAVWSGARRLDFRASIATDEFGGRAAHLDGRFALGAQVWSVACALEREEVEAREALWCLPLLRSVKPAS